MLDYNMAFILIISVFMFGFVGYFRPFVGGIGFFIWVVMLLPITLDPTVTMGTGFNATSGMTYLITETVTELRALSIISVIVCLACFGGGIANNAD